MNKLIIILILLFGCSPLDPMKELSVVSFNVLGNKYFDSKKDQVIDYAVSFDPDIIGLQEWSNDQKLKITGYQVFQYNSGTKYTNPIAIKRGRFVVDKWFVIWLSTTPNRKSKCFDDGSVRTALFLLIDDILVVNTHFPLYSREAKDKSFELINNTVKAIPHNKVIVVGDFNSRPQAVNENTDYFLYWDDSTRIDFVLFDHFKMKEYKYYNNFFSDHPLLNTKLNY